MKLRQQARVLKRKALTSFITAAEAFNSPRDDGRVTKVLLHLQHAFEMLLKAALVQTRKPVFDQVTGRSIGFERCIGLAMSDDAIKLSETDAGTLRAIDAMRDDEQHWFNEVSEQILYLHVRAGVTLFDDILQRVFGERLNTVFPERVLPVSADPPKDLALLLDDEYTQIRELLRPGRRAGHEARARFAPSGHGSPRRARDPRLRQGRRQGREGHPQRRPPRQGLPAPFRRGDRGRRGRPHDHRPLHQEGRCPGSLHGRRLDPRCRRPADRPAEQVPLVQGRARHILGTSRSRAVALRRHLGIDDDESCSHDFQFGSTRHRQYSDNALTKMREAVRDLDMDAIWKAHNPAGKACPPCSVQGCKAA